MRAWLRKWWPWIKAVLAIAILVGIGRQLAPAANPAMWHRPVRWQGFVLAGVFYLLGLGCSAVFWYRLLRALGQKPAVPAAIRAYYLGHLGKYLPGKAWALFLRAGIVSGAGVRMGLATITSLYEVLTTMTGGVLLAAVLLPWQLPQSPPGTNLPVLRQLLALEAPHLTTPDRNGILLLIGGLLVAVGLPIFPPVFNRLIRGMSQRFPKAESLQMPHLRPTVTAEGLLLAAGGWLLLGASLWFVLYAILPRPLEWDWTLWSRYSAFLALAYVAGFVIVIVPSGLGVREFFLTLFLIPEVAPLVGSDPDETRATVLLAVVLLRLIWTAAEAIITSIVYWLPSAPRGDTVAAPGPELATTDDGGRKTDA